MKADNVSNYNQKGLPVVETGCDLLSSFPLYKTLLVLHSFNVDYNELPLLFLCAKNRTGYTTFQNVLQDVWYLRVILVVCNETNCHCFVLSPIFNLFRLSLFNIEIKTLIDAGIITSFL